MEEVTLRYAVYGAFANGARNWDYWKRLSVHETLEEAELAADEEHRPPKYITMVKTLIPWHQLLGCAECKKREMGEKSE